MIIFIIGLIVLGIIVYVNYKPKEEIKEEVIHIEYFNDEYTWLGLINSYRRELKLSILAPIKELDDRTSIVLDKMPPVQHYYNGEDYEIVGGGHATLTALFRHYLNSPDHKSKIENADIKYIGIGIKKVDNNYYNVTLFR